MGGDIMFFLNKKMTDIRQKIMCSKGQHVWNGCKCSSCGETRDEGHSWDGCICTTCGAKRNEHHEWQGCVCVACGKTRDKGHIWDCCFCKTCGAIRKIEDGLEYYSDKPDCPGCDSVVITVEDIFSSNEDEIAEKNICPLSTIKCSKCGRVVLSSDETICFKNYRK